MGIAKNSKNMQRSTNKATREKFFMSTISQRAGTSLSATIEALALKQFNFIDTVPLQTINFHFSVIIHHLYLLKLHLFPKVKIFMLELQKCQNKVFCSANDGKVFGHKRKKKCYIFIGGKYHFFSWCRNIGVILVGHWIKAICNLVMESSGRTLQNWEVWPVTFCSVKTSQECKDLTKVVLKLGSSAH